MRALEYSGDHAPLGCQLDVAVLDEYLHSLLLTKFLNDNPLLGADERRTMQVVLSALLPAATIWMTQAQTPATKALGLKTAMTSDKSSVRSTKWKYIVATALLPLLYHGLQRLVLRLQQERQEEDSLNGEEEPDGQRTIARERQYTLAQGVVQGVEQGLPLCKLGLLLSFLWKPKELSHPPRLAMVLAGLRFLAAKPTTSASNIPHLYVLYGHRRWLYEESLLTFKLVFAPLMVSLQQSRRLVEFGLEHLLKGWASHWILSNNNQHPCRSTQKDPPCSLCGKHPIAVPYETDACQHVFCYTCLWRAASNINRRAFSSRSSTGYPCPVCRRLIRSSRPVPLFRYQVAKNEATEESTG